MRMEARPSETSGVRGLNETYLWEAQQSIEPKAGVVGTLSEKEEVAVLMVFWDYL